jgi:predicted TIM-barrel fold metal-dependent hydrolase
MGLTSARARRRVDLHAHFVPETYAAIVRDHPAFTAPLPDFSLDMVRELQARFAIDSTVLSVSHGVYSGDQGLARELARAINEAGAEIKRAEPDRFAALATLPLPDVDAALDELSHALDRLGLDGVLLHTNVAGIYLGDPAWDPLFEELNRRAAYVLMHPTEPPTPAPQEDRYPVWVAEFPFETTRATLSLIYTGTLARSPAVKLQMPHLGGTVPFLYPRMQSLEVRDPRFADQAGGNIRDLLGGLYYDTGLANHASMVEAALAVARPERIVFGTDWPYAALPGEGEDPAPDLGSIPDHWRARVDGRNAAALIPRWDQAESG